jgi:hypothetical protein
LQNGGSKQSNKKEASSFRPSNYVLISKKRGLSESINEEKSHLQDESKANHQSAQQEEFKDDSSKKQRILSSSNSSNLTNVNIIDVISSEYFAEEATNYLKDSNSNQNVNSNSNNKQVVKSNNETSSKENRLTCNGVEMIREKTTSPTSKTTTSEYIYDIYYTKNPEIHLDLLYANNYEIKSYNFMHDVDLVDDNANDDDEDLNGGALDEEDSNDETNWRNDYPDEDDDNDDVDDEDDDFYGGGSAGGVRRAGRSGYDEYDDDEYYHGYGDEEHDELSHYMKKSCKIGKII